MATSTYTEGHLEDVFDYLDTLRTTGATNMFGAAPYVQEAFRCSKGEAREMLSLWMQTYDGDLTSGERARLALGRC